MWLIGFALLTFVTLLPLFGRHRGQHGRVDYCEIIYPVAAYLYFGTGVRGLALCTSLQESPHRAVYELLRTDAAAPLYAFLTAAVAVGCLYAGYFCSRRPLLAVSRAARARVFAGPHDSRTISAFCFLGALATCVAGLYLWRTYNLPADPSMIGSTLAKRSVQGGLYPLTGWSRLAYIGFLVSAALKAKDRLISSRLAWLTNAATILSWYFLTSGKYVVFFLLLGSLIVRNYATKRVRLWSVALVAGVILLIYPALYLYRYLGARAPEEFYSERFSGAERLLERGDHFDNTLLVMKRVRGFQDLKLGSTFAEITYFYIPRSLWPGKPMSFGYRYGEEYLGAGYRTGQSGAGAPGLIGELFLNFDLPGVMCGMFLFGVFLKNVYLFFCTGSAPPLKVGMYALLVVDAMQLVEGPIASHLGTFIVDGIPIALMGFLASGSDKGRLRCVKLGGATQTRTVQRGRARQLRVPGREGIAAV